MANQSFHKRNLPHLYHNYGRYFITYCLNNSIQRHSCDKLLMRNKTFSSIDNLLDCRNKGDSYLLIPEIADCCKETIHYPDGKDYKLICYCIMPNHVHLVFELLKSGKTVSKIMQSIKRISAYRSNIHLKRSGTFWQDESYDRLIRDDKELYFIIKYVLNNPVKAGLAIKWDEWRNTYCQTDYLVI